MMTDIEKVHVDLGARSYDIFIGPKLIENATEYISPLLKRPHLAVVADETVAKLHLPALQAAFAGAGISVTHLSLPAGEGTKSWPYFTQTVEWLLDEKIERSDIVIALGGGVIGDLVGYAAASLRRGIRFVQMPTSLLAQVDSSVGGKTGINTRHGKNLVGAFHQPALVLADTDILHTLPPRDFLAGYGEVVKYGLLGNVDFFEWLEVNGPKMAAGDQGARIAAVKTSCQMKADIVARDETENGQRALLNLGHTFCHALEAATGYSSRLLHGEGVAIGCALAFEVSARMGLCAQETPSRVRAHLQNMSMKIDLSDIEGDLPSADEIIKLMYQDKKVDQGQLTFIMARDIGGAFITRHVPLDIVKAALESSAA